MNESKTTTKEKMVVVGVRVPSARARPLNQTIVALAIKTGLSKPKTLEYLQLLNEAGEFELDIPNDKIKKVTIPKV